MRSFLVAGLLMVTPMPLLAQFRLPIPNIPGVDLNIPIPGVEDLMESEPAVSTSIDDAQTEVTFLDDYNPTGFVSMGEMPQNAQDGFTLEPGQVYQLNAQSYCLHAGTHAPGGGDGYLYASLEGDREEIIHHILENSVNHPDLAQRDIQVLIWGIIARTKLNDMPDEVQATARQLLSNSEIQSLNGGVLGVIPDAARRELFANVPAEVRQVFEAEAEIRSLLTQGTTSFQALEQVAVLAGDVPLGGSDRQVPAGRWSYHPDGYFVRYFPSSYSHTQIQVAVPEPIAIARDSQGRITSVTAEDGTRIETTYNDAIAPLSIPGDATLVGYAFATIRYSQPDASQPGGVRTRVWNDTGWTFVSADGPVSSQGNPRQTVSKSAESTLLLAQDSRFDRWRERYETAQEWQERGEYYRDRWDAETHPPSAEDMDNIIDLGHYEEGLETVTGSQDERLDWIGRTHERLANALRYATCVISGDCSAGNSDSVDFDPADDVAVPANTSRQRLGLSGRSYD